MESIVPENLPQTVHPVENENTNPMNLGIEISEERRNHSTLPPDKYPRSRIGPYPPYQLPHSHISNERNAALRNIHNTGPGPITRLTPSSEEKICQVGIRGPLTERVMAIFPYLGAIRTAKPHHHIHLQPEVTNTFLKTDIASKPG